MSEFSISRFIPNSKPSGAFKKFQATSLAILAFATASFATPATSQAAIVTFHAFLDGPSEFPPVASPGTGFATVVFDTVAITMSITADFADLIGPTTVAHIHCCTAVPGAGTVGVATQPGTLTGFPVGVTSGVFSLLGVDMTDPANYTGTFLATFGGGTAAGAFAALLAGASGGSAYFNIHTSTFPGGEIRGFLAETPIPGALPLFVSGFGVIGLLARHRRKKAAAQ